MRILMASRAAAHAVITAIVLGLTAVAHAGQQPTRGADVSLLSLEDLMRVRIEPVFGASKREQPVTEAPASVTIVTADDIARYGFRTLADLLRSVRSFSVASDRNYSYIGIRGFALSSDYNSRILLLVDGHRMNDNIYDQASIGADFVLDPFVFDRVEIIRGPAASLYGTSAFFGVVNVITKSGSALAGGRVAVDAGTLGSASARASFGRRLASGLDFALSAAAVRTDGASPLFFPEYASEPNGGVVHDLDGERARQFNGRLGFGPLTVSAAFGTREKHVPTAAYGTVFGDPRLRTTDTRAFLDARYSATARSTRLDVRGTLDRYRYDGSYPTAVSESETVALDDYAEGMWVGIEARASRNLGTKHHVTGGVEFRQDLRQVQGGTDAARQPFAISGSAGTTAAFVQDEVPITSFLLVTAGMRFDAYDRFSRVTPRLAVIARPSPHEAFKYLYGTAFRAPNAYELNYYPVAPTVGPPRPETTATHEVVWERYVGRWLRTSASFFVTHADSLISLSADDDVGFTFVNLGDTDGRGLELEAEWRHRDRWQGRASYMLQRTTDGGTAVMLGSPTHTVQALMSASWFGGLVTSADMQYMSARRTLRHTTLDPVVLVNATVRFPVSRDVTLISTVRNLTGQAYSDPAPSDHRQSSIPQNGRTFRVGVEWGFRVK